MNDRLLSKHVLYGVLGAVIFFGLLVNCRQLLDWHSRIVYCARLDSGTTYMRIGTADIVINPTPGPDTIQCISRHIPQYDRTVDMVIVTDAVPATTAAIEHLLTEYSIEHIVICGDIQSKLTQNIQKTLQKHVARVDILSSSMTIIIEDSLLTIDSRQESYSKAPYRSSVDDSIFGTVQLAHKGHRYVWINAITDLDFLRKFIYARDSTQVIRMYVRHTGDPIIVRPILSGRDYQLIVDEAIGRSMSGRELSVAHSHNIDITKVGTYDIVKYLD